MLGVISVRLPTVSRWGIVALVPALGLACTFPDYWIDRNAATGSGGEAALPDGTEAGSSSGGGAAAPAASPCMQTYPTTMDGLTSRYKVVTTGRSWANAERDCETEGGHLIVIDDGVENDWMTSIAAEFMTDDSFTTQQAWIGLSDSATEETFEWVTGVALTLGPWATGEPNDKDDNEDCVQIAAVGEWNDDSCNEELAYVCECDGTPSAELWCDSQATETCGDCNTACRSDQACVDSKCE